MPAQTLCNLLGFKSLLFLAILFWMTFLTSWANPVNFNKLDPETTATSSFLPLSSFLLLEISHFSVPVDSLGVKLYSGSIDFLYSSFLFSISFAFLCSRVPKSWTNSTFWEKFTEFVRFGICFAFFLGIAQRTVFFVVLEFGKFLIFLKFFSRLKEFGLSVWKIFDALGIRPALTRYFLISFNYLLFLGSGR